jgi:AcrR family transcriptional regulator
MDAALAEFGAHGFSSGSLNVVAREARIAKGSLFQYFEDKLDVFAYTCDWCSQRIRDHMAATLAEQPSSVPFFDLLRAVMADWLRYFQAHPLDRAVTFAANFEIDEQARAAVREVAHRHYLDVLRPLVVRAASRGELRDEADGDRLLAMLILLLPHLALAPYARGLDPVLGLYGQTPDELAEPVGELIDALQRAFGSTR